MSTINNQNLLLHDSGSYTDPEVAVALEFIDYGITSSEKKQEENQLIIRNRLKIQAVRTNAQAFIRIQENFGISSKKV